MEPTFFATPADFRKWLLANHDKMQELLVGYYKKGSGLPSITWPESVDEALCFGWIDGIRRTIDDSSYCIRFTPRKPRSIWSTVNIKRIQELTELGLMEPTGIAAFSKREEKRSNVYAYEQGEPDFAPEQKQAFQAAEKAWAFFQAQPPSYRKPATWWVVSAKQEETRAKRLATLIKDSEDGLRLAQFRRPTKAKKSQE